MSSRTKIIASVSILLVLALFIIARFAVPQAQKIVEKKTVDSHHSSQKTTSTGTTAMNQEEAYLPSSWHVMPTSLDENAVFTRSNGEVNFSDYVPPFYQERGDPIKFHTNDAMYTIQLKSAPPEYNPNLYTAVEILKNGRRHALYNYVWDYAPSQDGKFIALKNATDLGRGKAQLQYRIIEVATKKSVHLPFIECTTHIQRWSQGKLLTSSNVFDVKGSTGKKVGQVWQLCAWDTNGKLLFKIQKQTPELTTGVIEHSEILDDTGDRPYVFLGFLPREPNTLYIFDSAARRGESPITGHCQITAIDTDKPSRRTSVSFETHVEIYYCVIEGSDHIELDLSNFTIEKPEFRYRIHHEEWPSRKIVVKDWIDVR